MTRECPVKGCPVELSGRDFMCREHWLMVPRELRGNIWHAISVAVTSVDEKLAAKS